MPFVTDGIMVGKVIAEIKGLTFWSTLYLYVNVLFNYLIR